MNLFRQFEALPCAASGNSFSALALPGLRQDYLAKGADGCPVFLLNDTSPPQYFPSIHYKYLKAQYHTTCKVHAENQSLEGQFAMVSCSASATELHEIFIRCFAAAIEQLPAGAGTRALSATIHSLLDLFRALACSNGRGVVGLWAELYIIAKCGKTVEALTAWHSHSQERFDFSFGGTCLEVKATTESLRVHHFNLEQLVMPVNGRGIVASLLLQPLSGGYGVLDLANMIDLDVRDSPSLRHKLWHNVALSLGQNFSSELDKHFDASFAERHIVLYNMLDIPKPSPPADIRISAIRFQVDLTTVNSSRDCQSLIKLF